MSKNRVERLNSLLKEVISDVIRKEVRNPLVSELLTVTHVDVSKDLSYAKVLVSVIGSPEEKAKTVAALQSAAGFIGIYASKEVSLRHFPSLTFKLDDSVDKQMRIASLIDGIQTERSQREVDEENQ